MSTLSDRNIEHALERGLIGIDPFSYTQLQPASYDLKLGRAYRRICVEEWQRYIDLRSVSPVEATLHVLPDEGILVQPQEFLLGVTYERITVGQRYIGILDGKSTLARVGLLIHVTGGMIDPGWEGNLTLEICNIGPLPVYIWPGMLVAQIRFDRLVDPALAPYGDKRYGSRYQGDSLPQGPKNKEE